MLRILFVLCLLVGIGYAVSRIPVGGKTTAQHLAALIDGPAQDSSKKAGARTAAKAKTDAKSVTAAKPAPADAPKGSGTVASKASPPPADRFSRSEKDALEKLMR